MSWLQETANSCGLLLSDLSQLLVSSRISIRSLGSASARHGRDRPMPGPGARSPLTR